MLSEYLNRYLRIAYDANWRGKHSSFRQFRKSGDCTAVLGALAHEVQWIRQAARLCDMPLCAADLASLMHAFQAGDLDFNDGLLIENCRINKWKLLTDDGDMTLGGIEVLTRRPDLLAACPG